MDTWTGEKVTRRWRGRWRIGRARQAGRRRKSLSTSLSLRVSSGSPFHLLSLYPSPPPPPTSSPSLPSFANLPIVHTRASSTVTVVIHEVEGKDLRPAPPPSPPSPLLFPVD